MWAQVEPAAPPGQTFEEAERDEALKDLPPSIWTVQEHVPIDKGQLPTVWPDARMGVGLRQSKEELETIQQSRAQNKFKRLSAAQKRIQRTVQSRGKPRRGLEGLETTLFHSNSGGISFGRQATRSIYERARARFGEYERWSNAPEMFRDESSGQEAIRESAQARDRASQRVTAAARKANHIRTLKQQHKRQHAEEQGVLQSFLPAGADPEKEPWTSDPHSQVAPRVLPMGDLQLAPRIEEELQQLSILARAQVSVHVTFLDPFPLQNSDIVGPVDTSKTF